MARLPAVQDRSGGRESSRTLLKRHDYRRRRPNCASASGTDGASGCGRASRSIRRCRAAWRPNAPPLATGLSLARRDHLAGDSRRPFHPRFGGATQIQRQRVVGVASFAAHMHLARGVAVIPEPRDAPAGWIGGWLQAPADCFDWSRRAPRYEDPSQEWSWRGLLPKATELEPKPTPDFWSGYRRTHVEPDARLAARHQRLAEVRSLRAPDERGDSTGDHFQRACA